MPSAGLPFRLPVSLASAFAPLCAVLLLASSPANAVAQAPVELTGARWVLEDSIDASGYLWNDSVLVFTSQAPTASGFDVAGYFDWISSAGHFGRELFIGTYTTTTRRVQLFGQSIDSTRPSSGITTATYAATLASDGQRFDNGAWSATNVIPGLWSARRSAVSPTLPQPPTALVARAIAGNTVTLTWNAPVDGPVPASYVLEGGGAPGQTIASLPTGSAVPLYTFTAPTGAFHLRVRTVAGGVMSAASNEIRIFVNQAVTPSAPAQLLGLVNGTTLSLSWRRTFAGGPATGYVLDVSGSLSASLPLGLAETFTFNGVPAGSYTFQVRAVNSSGTSAGSNPVTLSFPSACTGAPQMPTDVVAASSGDTLQLLWNPAATGPAATSYVLSVSGAFNAALTLAGRGISAAVPPGAYTFTVAAVNACGSSAASAPQTVAVQ